MLDLQCFRFGKQIFDDAGDFDRLQFFGMRVLLIRQVEELWHPRFGMESLGLFDPRLSPRFIGLGCNVLQSRPDFAHRTGDGFRIGGDAFGFFNRLRFEPHIGANGLAGVVAVDFVAAVTAILTNQLVPAKQLRGRGAKLRIDAQFDDVVMAFEAGGFRHPLRIHRVFPEVVRGIAVLSMPFFAHVGRIGGVRGVLKTGT